MSRLEPAHQPQVPYSVNTNEAGGSTQSQPLHPKKQSALESLKRVYDDMVRTNNPARRSWRSATKTIIPSLEQLRQPRTSARTETRQLQQEDLIGKTIINGTMGTTVRDFVEMAGKMKEEIKKFDGLTLLPEDRKELNGIISHIRIQSIGQDWQKLVALHDKVTQAKHANELRDHQENFLSEAQDLANPRHQNSASPQSGIDLRRTESRWRDKD